MTFYEASWARSNGQAGRPQKPANLNDLIIRDADGPDTCLRERPASVVSGPVEAVFHGLEARLCAEIKKWPFVFGCMAWLTNEAVLKSLATRSAVSIIVQKEDFLRPDNGGPDKGRLRQLYYALPSTERWGLETAYSTSGDPTLPAVMCAGLRGEGQRTTIPRMHNKFLVFCDADRKTFSLGGVEYHEDIYRAKAVWTGSFNATTNGEKSLENAVIIRDATIAEGYLEEFKGILGIAECLDWQASWICPEYRLGT